MEEKAFEFTNLIVLESLRNDEDKTGKLLAENLEGKFPIKIDYYDIRNKTEFYDLLENTVNKSGDNFKPILHLEIHGSSTNMGLALNSNELIHWRYLYTLCKEINFNTGNNLFLTLAVCRGAHLMREIKPYDRCPWSLILGSFKDLCNDDILMDFTTFYENLIGSNINIALEKLNAINPNANYEIVDSEETFRRSKYYFDSELKKEKDEKVKGKLLLQAIKRTSSFEEIREYLNVNYGTKILTEVDLIDYFSRNYVYATENMVNDFRRFFYFWK